MIEIATFYEFKPLTRLVELRLRLLARMRTLAVKGTVILADEGFNATVCGGADAVAEFESFAGEALETEIVSKRSSHDTPPFRKAEVKIKAEIVTLKRKVDVSAGAGTHIEPGEWNAVISDPDTIVIDARNSYEIMNGSFAGAIDPRTEKFSDLPQFVSRDLDPEIHKKVAMYCTGGIRCEKFAPYLRSLGFEHVYQLRGGILNYLANVPPEQSLWHGECFVFDDRITVDRALRKGTGRDHSLEIRSDGDPE